MTTIQKKLTDYRDETTNKLEKWVVDDVLAGRDDDEILGYVDDVLGGRDDREILGHVEKVALYGCSTGIVSDLIYYEDTTAFHDKFTAEIYGLLDVLTENAGCKTIYEYLASRSDAKTVGSGAQHKNFLAWLAYEETLYSIANELELN